MVTESKSFPYIFNSLHLQNRQKDATHPIRDFFGIEKTKIFKLFSTAGNIEKIKSTPTSSCNSGPKHIQTDIICHYPQIRK